MTTVSDITDSYQPIDISGLSLLHTANGEDFLSILNDEKIRTQKCRVFTSESLCYFFLGRPAYKTSVAPDPSYWQLPAIFAFEQMPAIRPKRIFPFDSGALEDGRYRSIIGKIERDSFMIGSNYDSVSRLLSYFFDSSEKYMEARAVPYEAIRKRLNDQMSAFPVLALSKLYNYPFNEEIDDRARLIEIQFEHDVPIDKATIKGIIICKEWRRDPKIESALTALGCPVKDYPIMPLSSSNYYAKIYELAQEL